MAAAALPQSITTFIFLFIEILLFIISAYFGRSLYRVSEPSPLS